MSNQNTLTKIFKNKDNLPETAYKRYIQDNDVWDSYKFETARDVLLYQWSGNNRVILFKDKATNKEVTIEAGEFINVIEKKIYGVKPETPDGFLKIKHKGKIGLLPLDSILVPATVSKTQHESDAVLAIRDYIESSGGVIDVVLKGTTKIYKNIRYVIKVQKYHKEEDSDGDPKADIILCEDKNKINSKNSIFISLKKGDKATDFLQYAGVTDKSGTAISKNKEVLSFLNTAFERSKDIKLTDRETLWRSLSDQECFKFALFGKNYSTNSTVGGLNNVHCVAQGDVKFEKYDETTVELSFSHKMIFPHTVSKLMMDKDYMPVIALQYSSGRHTILDSSRRINSTRTSIFPYAFLLSRKIREKI